MWIWEVEVNIAEALTYGGRIADARAHLDRVIEQYPLSKAPNLLSMAMRLRGIVRHAQGDVAGALADLEEALNAAVSGGGEFEEALCRFERARRGTDPDAASADRERSIELCARLGVEIDAVSAPTLV